MLQKNTNCRTYEQTTADSCTKLSSDLNIRRNSYSKKPNRDPSFICAVSWMYNENQDKDHDEKYQNQL